LRECDLDPPLRRAVVEALGERAEDKPPALGWQPIFRAWFASLARDYHPDRTLDDGRAMKIVNDAAERLRNLLELSGREGNQ
jgi:hypothetical protein